MSNFDRQSIKVALLAAALVLTASSVFSVQDNDMCLRQPVDQCQGNQFVELGSQDANTDGRFYWFESQLSNSNGGEIYLQFKGDSSNSFTNVSSTSFPAVFGSSGSVFYNIKAVQTTGAFEPTAFEIDGEEVSIEPTYIEPGQYVDFEVQGSQQYSENIGNVFTISGDYLQVVDAFRADESNQIADGQWYNFTYDGQQQTIYLNSLVDSNTIYAHVNGEPDNYNEGEIFSAGGATVTLSEVIYFGDSDGEANFTVDGIGPRQATFRQFQEINSPEGYNEYRSMWVGDDGSTSWSDSLFFSVDRAQNVPADKEVRVGGGVVDQPRTLTGVTPNSNINLTTFQGAEQDPMNVTLVASDGTEVATISQGDNYGAFRAVFDDISDEVLATFRGGTNSTFIFPTTSSDLLSQNSQTYKFYFEIKDKGEAGNPVRTTKTYTVQTSDTAENQAPSINSVQALVGGSWISIQNVGFGENIAAVRADITDPDNEFIQARLNLTEEYDGTEHVDYRTYDEQTGDKYRWEVNMSVPVDDSGNWSADVWVSDGTTMVTEERDWSFPWGEPDISVSAPSYVQVNQGFEASMTLTCPQYECINENETVNMYLDPKARGGLQ